MRRRDLLVALPLGAAALLAARRARALTVFDPANYSRNLITSLETLRTNLQLARGYALQVQQHVDALRQLQGIDPVALLRHLARSQAELREVDDYLQGLQRLYGGVRELQRLFSNRLSQARLARQSWPAFLAAEAERVERGVTIALDLAQLERNTLDRVRADYQAAQDLQRRIAHTAGTHEAMQLMNTQVNQLLTQQSRLLQLLAAQGMAQRQHTVDALGDRAGSHDALERARQRRAAAEADARARLATWNIDIAGGW